MTTPLRLIHVPPEVLSFVDAMLDAGAFDDAGYLARFYEKPWQWESEYLTWVNLLEPMCGTDPGWNEFVEATCQS